MSDIGYRIVVGIDGSPASKSALRWALRQARLTGGTITALMAWDYATIYTWEVPGPENFDRLTAQALDEVVEEVATDEATEIRKEVAPGNPARAILDAGRDAALIVVGSRGHGGFLNALLGSVSRSVATHSTCPVVVVHDEGLAEGPVVVGVDESPNNQPALSFAFTTARQRKADLLAMQALPPAYFYPGPTARFDRDKITDRAQQQFTEMLREWREYYPDVRVEESIHNEHPVAVLRQAAENAQLVVVGHRGHGGFSGLLLGSVATGVLHHAPCPVAVVRSDATG